MGEKVAAHLFCFFHRSVNDAGSTALEIMTPIRRYRYPMETPICHSNTLNPAITKPKITTHKCDM